MEHSFILAEEKNSVLEITLNRPDVLNSFNREMSAELQSVLRDAADNGSVRAILLTGSGKGFCAGQDLDSVLPKDGEQPEKLGNIVRDCYNPIVKAIRTIEKPVVCAVNGVAAGAGANLALCCDIVMASSKASFIQSFVHVGLIPDTAGTFFLPRVAGTARANAMAFLGEKVKADEAKSIGMIYQVCEPDELIELARAVATKLASLPTRGIGITKRLFNASMSNSLDSQLELEEKAQTEAGETADYKEGISAFLEKRPPVFTGN